MNNIENFELKYQKYKSKYVNEKLKMIDGGMHNTGDDQYSHTQTKDTGRSNVAIAALSQSLRAIGGDVKQCEIIRNHIELFESIIKSTQPDDKKIVDEWNKIKHISLGIKKCRIYFNV